MELVKVLLRDHHLGCCLSSRTRHAKFGLTRDGMSEPPPEEVVAEAEGVRLRLSDRTATGYEGVHWASGKRF